MRLSTGLKDLFPPDAGPLIKVERGRRHTCSEERVGRDGYLFLEYGCREHRTILRRSFFRNPLQVFQPIAIDGDRCAYTHILNPCGGLVGGDRLEIEGRLEKGTHVLLTTPSATRIYRSVEKTAIQTSNIEVGPDAVLEWIPDTVIPFAGSRFSQHLEVRLDIGATLFLWDAFSSGRIARGERWAFAYFKNEIHIIMSEGGKVLERYILDPSRVNPASLGLGETWDYFASFYIISGRPVDWSTLLDELASLLDQWPGHVMGGVSSLAIPGLALRIAAKRAVDLSSVQSALWGTARLELLGFPVPLLRKY